MTPPRVDIIVLNWNKADETIACIEALRALTYQNFVIRVIDNGSRPDDVGKLSQIAGIVLHQNERNLGYTGGNNQGMRAAVADGADYVWLLNNDARAAPDALAGLVARAESAADIGLVGPLIRDADGSGTIAHCCCAFDLESGIYDPITDIAEAQRLEMRTGGKIILYGTALLVRRQLIEKIGVLDDRLFAYAEDVDYSIRSWQAGFRNQFAAEVEILHDSPGRSNRHPYYFYLLRRNDLLVRRKYLSFRTWLKVVWWDYHNARRTLPSLGNAEQVRAGLAGLWDGWCGHGGPYDPGRHMPGVVRRLLFPDLA